MKKLLLIVFVSLLLTQFIFALNVQCSIMSSDNSLGVSARDYWTDNLFEQERAGANKQGYFITCKNETGFNETWDWGTLGGDPSRAIIISFPYEEYNVSWLQPEYDYTKPNGEANQSCMDPCIDSCVSEGNETQECIDYCRPDCMITCPNCYEKLTAKKYKLPLKNILTQEEIDWIQNIECNNLTIRPMIFKNITNVSSLIEYNDWFSSEDKWYRPTSDCIGNEECNCYVFSRLGQWVINESGDVLITYPRYARNRVKYIKIDNNVSLVSEGIGLEIPVNTTIYSRDYQWDGNIYLPETKDNSSIQINRTFTIFDVGFSNANLNFTRGIKLKIINESGKNIGFVDNGSFKEITTICDENTQEFADTLVSSHSACKIDEGDDLVVWTTHFTEYITFEKDSDNDGVIDNEDLCPNTILPEYPSLGLITRRFADIDGDKIFETKRYEDILKSPYSIKDTYGCSCEQILKFKPGNNYVETTHGCLKFTLDVFIRKILWAENL